MMPVLHVHVVSRTLPMYPSVNTHAQMWAKKIVQGSLIAPATGNANKSYFYILFPQATLSVKQGLLDRLH